MSFTLVLSSLELLGSDDLPMAELQDFGLEGVFEGEILAERAHEAGLETESYVLDSGEAPHNRDWVSDIRQGDGKSEFTLYFPDEVRALQAKAFLLKWKPSLSISTPELLPEKDWNAEWKKSFVGIDVAPFWRVVPPWQLATEKKDASKKVLVLNPGAGFGTGTHETTQLCLEFFGIWATTHAADVKHAKFLDFGSGSGILAIGAALFGVPVIGVEIDPLAIDNARDNASLNQVTDLIEFRDTMVKGATYDGVFANILKVVLLEFKDRIVGAWNGQGPLILSGLVDADVAPILAAFEPICGKATEIKAKNEWRAIYWSRRSK